MVNIKKKGLIRRFWERPFVKKMRRGINYCLMGHHRGLFSKFGVIVCYQLFLMAAGPFLLFFLLNKGWINEYMSVFMASGIAFNIYMMVLTVLLWLILRLMFEFVYITKNYKNAKRELKSGSSVENTSKDNVKSMTDKRKPSNKKDD